MRTPAKPDNEPERLADLRGYGLDEGTRGREYDELAELAASICGVPHALVNLIEEERQWFLATFGVDESLVDSCRENSICAHTILQPDFLEVFDTHTHELFTDDVAQGTPPSFRFYAGANLVTPNGHSIGVLCVFGPTPQRLSAWQRDTLKKLAQTIVTLFEARKQTFLREQAEARERQAIERTAVILETISDAFFSVDNDWCFTYINQQAAALSASEPEKLLGWNLWSNFPYLEHSAAARRLREAKASGRPVEFEHYSERTNRWLGVKAYPYADGLSVYFRDISEVKLAQDSLRDSEQLFRTTFERAAEGFAHVALDGTWIRVNDKLCAIVGYSSEELLKLTFQDITHPDDLEKDLLLTRQLVAGERSTYSLEKRYRRKDGRFVWVEITVSLNHYAAGEPAHFITIISDIQRRKEIEEELRLAREDFQLMVDGATDYAIIKMDTGGRIERWSTGAERLFGYSEEEALGQDASLIFTSEDNEVGHGRDEMAIALRAGRAEDDRWHRRKDGGRFWANGMLTPLYDNDGKLRGFAKILRDNTERRLHEEKTRYLANHDPLTGLANRASFSSRLRERLSLAQRDQHCLALHLLDLDRFKTVNDTLGHHVGDVLLKEVARRLQCCVRESDLVARLGGDEFVIIQSQVQHPDAAAALASKVVELLEEPYAIEGRLIYSGTSLGIALYPNDGDDPVELMKNADMAMYKAKAKGRHNYQFYDLSLRAESQERQDIASDLRGALANQEFRILYQPLLDLRDWRVTGVEALLRWQRTSLQKLSPPDFMSLADETGIAIQLGEWVLRTACAQNKAWQAAGLPPFRVSVNFSATQFTHAKFVPMVLRVLQETGLSPQCLQLELTEDLLMRNARVSLKQLEQLKDVGVRISIDDFGTGSSSLSNLKHFPVDALKIDRSFVQHIPHQSHDIAITSAIITLAKSIGVEVVAEGVETLDQLAFLEDQNCRTVQGYLFSPPVDARDLEDLLTGTSWSRTNPVATV